MKRVATILVLALAIGWLGSSAAVAWRLTRRAGPREMGALAAPSLAITEVRLVTSDSEELGAWYGSSGPEGPTVVLLHGQGGSRATFSDLMTDLLAEDVNCLALTLRSHGDSTGDTYDFGWSSRADVIAAVEFLEERRPDQPIIVVGSSLGAAAAIFAAPTLGERVSGYVLDCPYRDLASAAEDRCARQLPPVLDQVAFWGLRLMTPAFLEVDPELISPIDHVTRFPKGVPAVFLAGSEDIESPASDVQELATACNADSSYELFEGASHGGNYWRDRERFTGIVMSVVVRASGEEGSAVEPEPETEAVQAPEAQ